MNISDITRAYDLLSQSSFKGVRGVMVIDSGVRGPIMGFGACTHGNEPCGLVAFLRLLESGWLPSALRRGKIVLMLNNMKAAQMYLSGLKSGCEASARCLDINMNRLPEDFEVMRESEAARAKELLPLIETFDAGMDIHSTEQNAPAMIIQIKGSIDPLIQGMEPQKLIVDIASVQTGMPFCLMWGGKDNPIPVFEVECGQHTSAKSVDCAIRCICDALRNMNMVSLPEAKNVTREIYDVTDSVFFPDESYELTQYFPMFCSVSEGQVIASGSGADIVSPCAGHSIMAPEGRAVRSIAEEVMFLTKKVRYS